MCSGSGQQGAELTTVHVRRALEGDEGSLSWIVEHFTPALLLQASYRLSGSLRRVLDPEDLVQDVWAITLPRLCDLEARNGRWTPVLVRFLSTTLLHRLNHALRSHLRAEKHREDLPPSTTAGGTGALERLADGASAVHSRIANRELRSRIGECIERLGAVDHEILVLRGIEQLTNQEVAQSLGKSPAAVANRYRRALEHLRDLMPGSIFDEISEDLGDSE